MSRNKITPEIGEQIKVAHAAGIGLREFARNANIPEGTVLSFAKRHGLTQQIATAKVAARPELARQLANADAINAITPMQSVHDNDSATRPAPRGTHGGGDREGSAPPRINEA